MFTRRRTSSLFALAVGVGCLLANVSSGQTLFEDDFDDDDIDTAKWRIDDRAFETGGGDYEAVEAGGILTISGTSTMNWWGGLALATIPTFTASADSPLTFEVARVSHDGTGSSTRTSVWITDAARENYVLFSHNANEGGWTYNKRVGEADDNPTAGGLNIFEFDDRDADFGLHVMELVADGQTVQLFLDDTPGPVVSFPFSEGIVFEIGAYARQGSPNQDMITGVFDNVLITGPAARCVSLTPAFTETLQGETPELTLQIPPDAARPATVTITSSAPNVAVPMGAVDGALTVTFGEGDEPSRIIAVEIPGEGLAEFTMTSEMELCDVEPVRFSVPAVLLEDDFEDDDLDPELWREDFSPFEDGDGSFDYVEEGGSIRLFGEAAEPFWPGVAIMSNGTFSPTPESPVRFQIDMTLTSMSMGTYRSGVWIADCDRQEYVFFSFIGSATDWTGNSTTSFVWPLNGQGQTLAAFECCGFEGLDVPRQLELLADGDKVAVFLDGIRGGQVPFEFDNVSFGFGAYAMGSVDEFVIDSVEALFDNARVIGQTSTIGDGCDDVPPVGPLFSRADANADDDVNITDGIFVLNYLFLGGETPICLEAGNANDDGELNITDGIFILNFLFLGGPSPPAPWPDCGEDPTSPDAVGCAGSQPGCL